ncbi:MAG TPA: hypothetical protein VL122_04655 [Nitrospirota bacterium]|nr:hypothetical protein [Nitrospirota bacterium]
MVRPPVKRLPGERPVQPDPPIQRGKQHFCDCERNRFWQPVSGIFGLHAGEDINVVDRMKE